MTKYIVNTELVKVIDNGASYQMHILCKSGQIVEHEPFSRDLEGLVAAISLSAEICAGKFYLSRVLTNDAKKPAQLESKKGAINE